MTDDADLTPEREAAVRRFLGSVGSSDGTPLPPGVAARLDATLRDLVAGQDVREPDEPLARVVPLSSRRRRVFAGLFVAAAAVVVAGIGAPLLHDQPNQETAASSDTSLTRTEAGSDSAGVAGMAPADGVSSYSTRRGAKTRPQADSLDHKAVNGTALSALTAGGLRTSHLRTDLVRLRRQVPPDATYRSAKVHAADGFTCATAAFGRGYLLGTRYAGAPVVVAFRAPVGSTQVAEVLQCGTAVVLRSVTLPTR